MRTPRFPMSADINPRRSEVIRDQASNPGGSGMRGREGRMFGNDSDRKRSGKIEKVDPDGQTSMGVTNRILQRIKYAGGTFSGKKSYICCAEFIVVGHKCTYEGRRPEAERMTTILNWGDCPDVSGVRAFLGTCGLCRVFIKNFSEIAEPLHRLTRKGVPFEWGEEQRKAMQELKDRLATSTH